MAAATALKIGKVAQRSGLSVKTIRFYCDEGWSIRQVAAKGATGCSTTTFLPS
jgi:hypothetical protein